jgi:2-iminobutanoate/2-iminopropanoate deaminase
MRSIHLFDDPAPISDAVVKNGVVYAAAVPCRPDGSIETGDIEAQADFAFQNLRDILEAAGGSLKDVVQAIVYLTDVADAPKMTEVWKNYFSAPFPNRATIGITALTVPGMKIEVIATAVLPETDRSE